MKAEVEIYVLVLRTCSLSNIGVENAILLLKVMTLTIIFEEYIFFQ